MKHLLAMLLLLALLALGGGLLLAAQSPLPAPASTLALDVYYDFDSACPEWQVRESTGHDGPAGSDWYSAECGDGNLEIQVSDRWEHVTASPLVTSPESPFEIQTRIYFQDRTWSSSYALVFGIQEPDVIQYYRVNVVYLSDGWMKYQVKRCESDHCSVGETLTLGLSGADASGYIQVDKAILNGQEWNDWRIMRANDIIRIYVNDNVILNISDSGYSGVGFFGLQVSTWEFQPSSILVDYYNVVSLASDGYEPDDVCTEARPILTQGIDQVHAFIGQGDTDWVTFSTITDTTYLIQALVPPGSPADVALELYDGCDAAPLHSQDHDYSPDARLEFRPASAGPFYLKLYNHDPLVSGTDLAYHVSVRALDDEPAPGALVLAAGRSQMDDPLQPNIRRAADSVYQLFSSHGYDAERITYLSTFTGTSTLHTPATASALQAAITTWAQEKVGPDRPFILYLLGDGNHEEFYLDSPQGETVGLQEIRTWLTQLEAAVPGVQVHVIIDAPQAGSFMKLAWVFNAPEWVMITAAGDDQPAYPSDQGLVFSDYFVQALAQGHNLYSSFQTASWATQIAHPDQTPWLDDNGNGIANETWDGLQAVGQRLSLVNTSTDQWPPYVAQANASIEEQQGLIRAQVRDDQGVERVWAMIYPPSYQPGAGGGTLQETLLTIELTSQGEGWYEGNYSGLTELGTYRVVIYAQDNAGAKARPLAIDVVQGWRVYLPLVLR